MQFLIMGFLLFWSFSFVCVRCTFHFWFLLFLFLFLWSNWGFVMLEKVFLMFLSNWCRTGAWTTNSRLLVRDHSSSYKCWRSARFAIFDVILIIRVRKILLTMTECIVIYIGHASTAGEPRFTEWQRSTSGTGNALYYFGLAHFLLCDLKYMLMGRTHFFSIAA